MNFDEARPRLGHNVATYINGVGVVRASFDVHVLRSLNASSCYSSSTNSFETGVESCSDVEALGETGFRIYFSWDLGKKWRW